MLENRVFGQAEGGGTITRNKAQNNYKNPDMKRCTKL